MATLLLLGAGRFQMPFIRKAQAMGHRVIAVDGDARAAGLALADQGEICDIRDVEGCLALAKRFAVDGVASFVTEAAVLSTALVARELGLPGLSPDVAGKAVDKHAMRRAFAGEKLGSTDFTACHDLAAAKEAFGAMAAPVVIKPSIGAGSRGVTYVDAAEAVAPAYEMAQVVAGAAPVLVEAYIAGKEVAVEAFMAGNRFLPLCVSEKIRTDPPFLLDLQILYPAPQPEPVREAVLDLAEAAVRALGIDNAPLHIEIILAPDGPRLVEIAARGAGFHVFSKIVPWVTGIDVIAAQIDLALGETPVFQPPLSRGAVLDFPLFGEGLIRDMGGCEKISDDPDMLFCHMLKEVGDRVGPLRSGADRVAAMASRGETLEAAREKLAWARSQLQVNIEPEKVAV